MSIKQRLITLPQYLLPQHAASGLMSKLTHCRCPLWKNAFIKLIIKLYRVNLDEAKYTSLDAYPCFNDFFTRELKPDARPIAPDAIVSPADGVVSQSGAIRDGRIFQAKQHDFSLQALLGGDAAIAAPFADGQFVTIYLSPKDYHRLHMPLTGTLKTMIHIPGDLFSVNAATVNSVPGLFARNERVVCVFDTEIGAMALILVGAIFVSSIETVWHGVVTPPTGESIRTWQYAQKPPLLEKGTEMGRFNMGSTIIVLFGNHTMRWLPDFVGGKAVKLGEAVGLLTMKDTLYKEQTHSCPQGT